jgi:3-oxo-5-alpha-steroid 4-dehydrogenase 1
MSEETFNLLIGAWLALALLLAPIQLVIVPAYGRHRSAGWGPQIGNRLGWIVMELVSPAAFLLPLGAGLFAGALTAPVYVFVLMWVAHYANRSLVYPFAMRTSVKTIPLAIVASAILFNAFNGWSNGYYLASPWAEYGPEWLGDPRFVAGLALFLVGAAINIDADRRLIRLRRGTGHTDYVIPQGGLFRYVSCPNHLGEIIEWSGFALACWNLPAAAFAVWTAANLGPRAWAHHRWYRRKFADYPPGRKALIPFLL